MSDSVDCPVCLEEYRDPRVLPCEHTLCLDCVVALQKRRYVRCPVCHSSHRVPPAGVTAFPQNKAVTEERKKVKGPKDSQPEHSQEVQSLTVATENCSFQDEPQTRSAKCEHEPKYQEGPGDKRKILKKVTPSQVSNSLSFSRQKLALIQCKYDPKTCSHCGCEKKLKGCAKCGMAKYCSKECQIQDWKAKHKADCKEIKELNEAVQKGASTVVCGITEKIKKLKAVRFGEPWQFVKNMLYCRIHLQDDKLIGIGDNVTNNMFSLDIYDVNTGERELECPLMAGSKVHGICMVNVENTPCIAVSLGFETNYEWLIEFWAYPLSSRHAFYKYHTEPFTIGPVTSTDDKLYVVNWIKAVIQEFDTSSRPITPTGLEIPTGQTAFQPATDLQICAGKEAGEKLILLNFHTDAGEVLRCYNYRGRQLLWEIKPQSLEGGLFKRRSICTDKEGRIFTADLVNRCVAVKHEDLSHQTLLTTPRVVGCIEWCDVTNKLCVVHFNSDATRLLFSRYDITEQ